MLHSAQTKASAFPFGYFGAQFASTAASAHLLVCLRLKLAVTHLPPRLNNRGTAKALPFAVG